MSHNEVTSIAQKPLRRRDLNARATRVDIIAAARAAFARDGYAAVRLEDVAAAANATTGAIYHHFGGKSALLFAVAEAVELEVVRAISATAPKGGSAWDAIRHAVTTTLDLCSRPEVARIIFREAPNVLGAAAWREVEMRYGLGGFHALFRNASGEGTLQPDRPAMVARLVMAALVEAVDAVAEDRNRARIDAVNETMMLLLSAFQVSA
jgi:AcrR family transcriptional regulator